MPPPFPIPADAVRYIDTVFKRANSRVSLALSNSPNTHEESLDLQFIASLAEATAPRLLDSGCVVDVDVHFIGGGNHIQNRWEVADIGVIVLYRRGGELVRTKIALLQSKRLYPREVDFVEAEPIAKPGGFG